MMTSASDSQLQQGLAMTRKMLQLVKAEEWEELAALSSQRLQLFRQWNSDIDPDKAQAQIGILQEIQALDREIEILGQQGRDQAAEHLRQIHQGRKADKAYRG
jgi:hypothetical protein